MAGNGHGGVHPAPRHFFLLAETYKHPGLPAISERRVHRQTAPPTVSPRPVSRNVEIRNARLVPPPPAKIVAIFLFHLSLCLFPSVPMPALFFYSLRNPVIFVSLPSLPASLALILPLPPLRPCSIFFFFSFFFLFLSFRVKSPSPSLSFFFRRIQRKRLKTRIRESRAIKTSSARCK